MQSYQNLFIVFYCLPIFIDTTKAQYNQRGTSEMAQILSIECRRQNTTNDNIQAIFDVYHEPPYESKCILACILKKVGVMTDDGVFSIEGTRKLYQRMAGEDSDDTKYRYIVMMCKHLNHPHECENAYLIKECMGRASRTML